MQMNKTYQYISNHKVAILAFVLYYIGWSPLLVILLTGKVLYEPIIVGEFPLMPILTLPFSIIILTNAVLRKEHKLFYIIISVLIYAPFIIISLKA